MDAERLTFADLTFDRVVCRFGLMLMPAAERALAEMHRVLVPGGRIGVAVWSAQSKVNTLGIVRRALERHDAFHPPPGAPDLFRFGKAGAMERALRKAGFRHVRSERVMALMTAAEAPIAPASPQPLTPSGLPGHSVVVWESLNDGRSSARGMV